MLEWIYFFKLVFFFPLQIIPRHRIAGSYGSPVFNFLRKLHTLFHSGCTSSLPTSSALRAPFLHVPPAVGTACLCDDGTGRCEAPFPLFAPCPHWLHPSWQPQVRGFSACSFLPGMPFPTSFGPLAMSCEHSHASVPTGSQWVPYSLCLLLPDVLSVYCSLPVSP